MKFLIQFPPKCTELHYEVELAVVIGKGGSKIAETKTMDHVAGYALALDMTARNLQMQWRRKVGARGARAPPTFKKGGQSHSKTTSE